MTESPEDRGPNDGVETPAAGRSATDGDTTDASATDGTPRTDTGSARLPSRRDVLVGAGGVGLAVGLGRVRGQEAATYELAGDVSGWVGVSPDSIADAVNPTLTLEADREYAVTWENADGLPHNFVVRDADGEDVIRSEIMAQQGATQTVTFTATPEMAQYLCEVHPGSMVGEVSVNGGDGGTTTRETTEEEPGDGDGFFREGTEVGVRTVAGGMTAPTDYAVPDDGSGRGFVTDQTGEVWVVTANGRQETPFVDVSDRLVTLGEFDGSYASPFQDYDERGLLGIEFHPAFADNRRFYLHYSAPPNDETPDGWDHVEVVSEFTASADLNSGDPDSERPLLEFQKPQYNHDGGPMAFGPDGYLYVPMGDGGGADDDLYGHVEDWYEQNSGGNGQDVTENLLGNVLRIDVDGGEGDAPYGIPEDNPFVGTEGLDEIYAYGFRNPFGISFDGGGNLFVADAGQNLFEEVNVVERGGNYGWNVKEGTHCFSTEDPSDPTAITDCPTNEPNEPPYTGGPLIDPIVEFPHTYRGESVGITVVGGHRYEASTVPGLQGKYVFGAWTTDPARSEPDGRLLAATPPAEFDAGRGEGPSGEDNETGTGTTGMTVETANESVAGTGTDAPDPADVPVDRLWDMEELVVEGGFDYFVRMFGQRPNGEVYVLANRRGVPDGNTGVLLALVPPDGEGANDGTTADDGTNESAAETTPGATDA